MKLAFEEHGNGKAFVLLHAFPLNRKMWKPQIKDLEAENFRVIMPDLRGFGESYNFADINSMEDMAKDVAELLDDLKIERAIVGGLSMGGYVLLSFYDLFPEKCAALVFCDTTYAADSDEKRQSRFEMIERIEKNGADVLIEDMLPNLIGDFTMEYKKDLIAHIEKMFSEANPQAAISALRGMAQRKDYKHILREIEIPTLLIFGVEDKAVGFEVSSDMNDAILNSTLLRIKNAGHYSNLEQPEQFNSALTDFGKSVDF